MFQTLLKWFTVSAIFLIIILFIVLIDDFAFKYKGSYTYVKDHPTYPTVTELEVQRPKTSTPRRATQNRHT